MAYLILGIILFAVPHLYSTVLAGHRDGLRARIGEKKFKGLYSLVSLAGVALMVVGFIQSRSGDMADDWLYLPPDWGRHVAYLIVFIAIILITASNFKGRIRLAVYNPMSWGFALWSAGHLLVNGKRADIYIFGTVLLIALADIVFSTLRGKRPSYEPKPYDDIIAVVLGAVVFAFLMFVFHPYVLRLPLS